VIFRNEVKGKSALALSRDLDLQYKAALVLAYTMRKAMVSKIEGAKVDGVGSAVEIDEMYVSGYVKPASHKEDRRDRRLAKS
jgi:hypothetical protein